MYPEAHTLSPDLLAKVKRLHIKSSHLVNAVVAGNYQSAFRGKGIEFQEVRQYAVGDDIRDIDWNVTARMGEPFVKVFHEERELTLMILVDVSASNLFGSHGPLKRDLLAELAAVLAFAATKNNDKVGLVLFSDDVECYLPPRKGRSHVWRLIREILRQRPTRRRTNLRRALEYVNRVGRAHDVVFVLSDFLDDGDYQRALASAAHRFDLTGVVVRDPLERALPPVGLMQIEDPESGRRLTIDTRNPALRRRLQTLMAEKDRRLRALFRRHGVEPLFVDTTVDYMPLLQRLMHKREGHR